MLVVVKTTLNLSDDLVSQAKALATHHDAARAWLSQARNDCVRGRQLLTLLPMVVTDFLRLVTSPRVFNHPDTVEDAVAFLDAVLETPGVQLGSCGNEWPLLRNTLLTLGLPGNLITDAWIFNPSQYISSPSIATSLVYCLHATLRY